MQNWAKNEQSFYDDNMTYLPITESTSDFEIESQGCPWLLLADWGPRSFPPGVW